MNKPQAAVIGAGLVSFMADVSLAQRSSVKLALLQAEQETRFAFEHGLITDWYGFYKNKLKFYGWDALPASEVHWPDNERSEIVDKALLAISAVAGSQYARGMQLAMHGLNLNTTARLQFEQRTREQGVFQLLPCAPARNGCVDMVVYHEALEQSQLCAGFLFRERTHQRVKAELVRFNVRLFEQQFRAKVEKSLEAVALREIIELQI
ncbi:hypothetical protein [Pseudomonas sp. DG56-2]|uniref:hypothetical protein n=1 Tax=Pseudomonas sp. DG56-2 TaxID=2320270 RepID=UPI0010A5CFDE|nr:hypothetical protein [Pseudomonas sp. DG56-2]